MKTVISAVALALVLAARVVVSAAVVDYPLVGAAGVYTLVNLHPDEQRQRLYSVNYLQSGLIPLCSKVKIESVETRKMTFRLLDSGREYEYVFHNSLREPIAKPLDKMFGKRCDAGSVEKMSQGD